MDEPAFYSQRYAGYSDDELIEVIDTNLFSQEFTTLRVLADINGEREDSIKNGKLLHFREVDKSLELPRGTARRLLNVVARRYGLVPKIETDNIIRYVSGE